MGERLAALRPAPERGYALASGAVALAVLVYLLNDGFNSEWGDGVHFAYSAVAAAFAIVVAAAAPLDDEQPRPWQSALYAVSFVLTLLALAALANVLGVDAPLDSSGTLVWIGALLALVMGGFAHSRNSGVSTLLGAVALGGTVVAFVDWVFEPEGTETFRWVLLLVAVAFGGAGASRRESRPSQSLALVDAAGLVALALAITFLAEGLFGSFTEDGSPGGPGWGWELFLLAAGVGLIAYAMRNRASGPGYLGAANLVAFAMLAGAPGEDGPSLIGWPLVLLLVTATLLALALRPSRYSGP